ncbi:tetratricopeptide repeat protein [Thermodesulfobacteriota bacterium]
MVDNRRNMKRKGAKKSSLSLFFKDNKDKFAILLFLTAIIAVIYLSSFTKAFLIDDMLRGETVSAPDKTIVSTMKSLKYPARVLTNLTFAINYNISNNNNRLYFMLNVLLHIVNSFLIFVLSYKLMTLNIFIGTDVNIEKSGEYFNISIDDNAVGTGRSGFADKAKKVAFISSLIFAIHPIAVYSVTVISNRAMLMSSILYLLSLIAFVNFKAARSADIAKRGLIASIVISLLAVLSKESAISLLFVFFAFEFIFFDEKRALLIKKVTIYLVAALLFEFAVIALPMWALKSGYQISTSFFDVLKGLLFFLLVILLPNPNHLSVESSLQDMSFMSLPILSYALLVIFIIAVVAAVMLRKKAALLSFLIIFYMVNIISEMIFANGSSYLHRAYLASFAIFFVVAYLSVYIHGRVRNCFGSNKYIVSAFSFSLLSIMLALTTFSIKENAAMKTRVTMYEDALIATPDKESVQFKLGMAYHDGGALNKAVATFEKMIEQDDANARALFALGNSYFAQKQYPSAEKCFVKVTELDAEFVDVYLRLGELYKRVGRDDSALESLLKAVSIDGGSLSAQRKLAELYYERGDLKKSADQYERVLELLADDPYLYYKLANIYDMLKDYKSALKNYELVLELDIDFEHKEHVDAKIKEMMDRLY